MMWQGKLVSIHICEKHGGDTVSVPEVQAIPRKGLKGDRHYMHSGQESPNYTPSREITLIEYEAIDALERESNISIDPGEARRNLVTKDVPLNHLVEKEFQVGGVTLIGKRLCEPCEHLADMTQKGVLPGLVHRGGLRAQILSGGIIRVGDTIKGK